MSDRSASDREAARLERERKRAARRGAPLPEAVPDPMALEPHAGREPGPAAPPVVPDPQPGAGDPFAPDTPA